MVVFGLLVLLGFPVVALAHDETKPEMPTLTISEIETVRHEPDMAFVTFGVDSAGKSLGEAQRRNSAVMRKVMDRLRDLQIDKELIQTSSFTVSPHYRPPANPPADVPPASPEIVGYVVSNMVTVPLSLAWEAFGEKNGAASLEELRLRIAKFRTKKSPEHDPVIGCTMLANPFFFAQKGTIR